MRIAICAAWWPMTVARYLVRAAVRGGHWVRTLGPSRGDVQDSWEGRPTFPGEGTRPFLEWREAMTPHEVAVATETLRETAEWSELWLDVHGGWFCDVPVPARRRVFVATDPHAMEYPTLEALRELRGVHELYTMQGAQRRPGEKWLPYGHDPEWFRPLDVERTADVTNLGAPYASRVELSNRLTARGLRVLGPGRWAIGEEHARDLQRAPIALVWPMADDLPMRVFEALACGLAVVTRNVPDLRRLFPPVTLPIYRAEDLDEARPLVEVLHIVGQTRGVPELWRRTGPALVARHSWDRRLEQLIEGRSEP